VCGGGWLHARVLCGWDDRCEVSAAAVHGEGNSENEVNQSRPYRAAKQVSTPRAHIEGGSPPSMVVAYERGHGGCCGRGQEVWVWGGGNGESTTANTILSRYTNVIETYQRPTFVVYHTVEVRMYPHV